MSLTFCHPFTELQMPVEINDVMAVLCQLADEENLRVTVTEALKGGAIAGAGAFVGALLGGPVGMAAGKQMTDRRSDQKS